MAFGKIPDFLVPGFDLVDGSSRAELGSAATPVKCRADIQAAWRFEQSISSGVLFCCAHLFS
jgi:hypothetical protein